MPVGQPLFLFSVGERTMYVSDVHEHIWLPSVRKVFCQELIEKVEGGGWNFEEALKNSCFDHALQDGVVYFSMAPSIGVVYLVTETQK